MMDKTDTTTANGAARQDAVTDEGAASMPMHRRRHCEFQPNSFVDRGHDDEPRFDPMIGSRFMERR